MITVFGSVNIDLIGIVGRLPVLGETVIGNDFVTAPGGKGANQALAAARAGGSVQFCGAIGAEASSIAPLDLLAEAGVDLSRVKTVPGPTGTALILVEPNGNNIISVFSAANTAVDTDDARGLSFKPGDVLLMQMEVPTAAMITAAQRARSGGAAVVLNVAPFNPSAVELIPLVDVLVVNETECFGLARILDIEEHGAKPLSYDLDFNALAKTIQRRARADLVITLGDKGVAVVTEQGQIQVDAYDVDVIDAVGAGDTFCGTLAARLDGDPVITRDKLSFASAAAGLACTKRGAQTSIPFAPETRGLMMSQCGNSSMTGS